MTTTIMIFLSGVLGAIVGYALGKYICANSALQFGKWNIWGFKGKINPNMFYFTAEHDKAMLSVWLNKNGDVDFSLNRKNAN